MSNGIVYGLFKIKQSDIVEKLCVNRNQPSKHCEGKCFLKDRFEEKNNENGDKTPFTNVEESVKINFIQPLGQEALQRVENSTLTLPAFHLSIAAQSYFATILQPPDTSLSVS